MLGVGIDWAEEFHLAALGQPGEGVIDIVRVAHDPAAIARLVTRIGELEPDPTEVRVVIETRHGVLVEALVDAGYTVRVIQNSTVKIANGPLTCADAGRGGADKGLLNNPQWFQ